MNTEPRKPVARIRTEVEEPAFHAEIIRILKAFKVLPVKLDVITYDCIKPYVGSVPRSYDGNVYHIKHVGRCVVLDPDEEDEETFTDSADLGSHGDHLITEVRHQDGFWWITGVYGLYNHIKAWDA